MAGLSVSPVVDVGLDVGRAVAEPRLRRSPLPVVAFAAIALAASSFRIVIAPGFEMYLGPLFYLLNYGLRYSPPNANFLETASRRPFLGVFYFAFMTFVQLMLLNLLVAMYTPPGLDLWQAPAPPPLCLCSASAHSARVRVPLATAWRTSSGSCEAPSA